MSRRPALLLLACLCLALNVAAAEADPTFVFLRSFQDPNNFSSKFNSCIDMFRSVNGPTQTILNQLDGAEVVVSYQKGSDGVANPTPGGNSTGQTLYLSYDPNLSGRYDDKSVKDPCAALLHELQHAARYFSGKECTGTFSDNPAAYEYDERLGARAENFWLSHLGVKQRVTYPFGSKQVPLGRWTRWPASSSYPIPRAPRCVLPCPQSRATASGNGGTTAEDARVCRRCTAFHQAGCFDFHGGIYSGGDHRRVANGSLKIIIGDVGYCQNRPSCEFKEQVTAPHLDTAFPEGATVTAIATPGKDSRFARWGPGACKGKGPECSFTATKDSCISAQFLLTNPTAPPQSLPTIACREDP